MDKIESLEAFYERKFDWIPDNLKSEIGHFNVFKLAPFIGPKAEPVPYKRRDFYKIMLTTGRGQVHYADRIVTVTQPALTFSNPHIPYKWEHLDDVEGVFCIFNHHFFHQYGQLGQYDVFQPKGHHIFELTDAQALQVEAVFSRMFEEINSDYIHKYDVLRHLVFELVHFALKTQPSSQRLTQPLGAAQRISALFIELLERQFPIDEGHPTLQLRTPADFAWHLNIHVNHLNRAVKTCLQKTTSELIAERLLQEAKILLRHSHWTVAQIAFALGFKEVTHFNNFFKKHVDTSPSKFRQAT